MIRLFKTHKIRQSQELEGMWEFATTDEEMEPDVYPYRLAVPGCWEAHPDLNRYRGIGFYRRVVEVQERSTFRFEFKGVSHTADVFFDGKPIADHYNAYTEFNAVAADVEPGKHELLIRVDNRFNSQSALHISNDYYTYGGIIRPVVMEKIPYIFIERLAFTPAFANGEWSANVRVHVRNTGTEAGHIRLDGELAGIAFESDTIRVEAGSERMIELVSAFPGVMSWSPAHPRLYELEMRLYLDGAAEAADDLIERVGFRTVAARDGQLTLNGEAVAIKGFCRHEDHPQFGAAIPLQAMVADLQLMLDMGANAVRTSHYPNDERFLDLCDELGLLVWEENHARGLDLAMMQNVHFERQCEDCNREMVTSHYNHPSIIIWGILNECASDTQEGERMYRKQLAQIRELDGSRPLTYASNKPYADRSLDAVDIVSFNQYPGWYSDKDPGETTDRLKQWVDEHGGRGKPLIISEFGADGLYGVRDAARARGTEERQADILAANLEAYAARPYVNGVFIWQFCDCRVTEEPDPNGRLWPLTRAGAMNNKGVVDRYRRPKLAYEVVKKHFAQQ